MTGWILILMLVGREGAPVQLETVPGFQTAQACNDAGMDARAFLPSLSPPGGAGRVDWVCVETGSQSQPAPARDACEEREAGRARLREEFRRLSSTAAREMDAALEGRRQ